MAGSLISPRSGLILPRTYQKPTGPIGLDPRHPLSRGLLGFWPMGSSHVSAPQRDISRYGNDIVPVSQVIGTAPTPFGGVGTNAGYSNYLQSTSSEILGLTGPMSMVAFFYPTVGLANGMRIWGCLSSFPYNGYELGTNGGNSYFQVGNAGSLQIANWSSSNLVSGTWYMAVGIYDGSNGYLYYNGVQQASFAGASNAIGATTQPLNFLGPSPNDSGVGFSGYIFGWRLYNRALSPDEVYWLYAEPFAGTFTSPKPTVGVSGGGNITLALTGVQANSAVGSVSTASLFTLALTGTSSTSAAGSVGTDQLVTIGLTGNQAQSAVGTVGVIAGGDKTFALTGTQAQGQAGNVTASGGILVSAQGGHFLPLTEKQLKNLRKEERKRKRRDEDREAARLADAQSIEAEIRELAFPTPIKPQESSVETKSVDDDEDEDLELILLHS